MSCVLGETATQGQTLANKQRVTLKCDKQDIQERAMNIVQRVRLAFLQLEIVEMAVEARASQTDMEKREVS